MNDKMAVPDNKALLFVFSHIQEKNEIIGHV